MATTAITLTLEQLKWEGQVQARHVLRAKSPTRVLTGPEPADEVATVLNVPNLGKRWAALMRISISGWQSWELPIARTNSFWKAALPQPNLQDLLFCHQGTGAYLLGLLGTFPQSRTMCEIISNQTFAFLLWDNWLKKYSTADDRAAFAGYMQRLEPGIVSQEKRQPVDGFVERLERKYPERRKIFEAGLLSMTASQQGNGWLRHYLNGWRMYSGEGLRLHAELAEQCRANKAPALDRFLASQSLSRGTWKWIMLAVLNHNVTPLDDTTLQVALPLIAVASMYVSIYSDIYLFRRGTQSASASLNSVMVYDLELAVLLQNSLLSRFVQEREVLSEASWLEPNQREAINQFVHVVEGSLQGLVSWHQFPSRYQGKLVEAVEFREDSGIEQRREREVPSWLSSHIDRAMRTVVTEALA